MGPVRTRGRSASAARHAHGGVGGAGRAGTIVRRQLPVALSVIRPEVNPGTIQLAGENHIVRLRIGDDGPESLLLNFFRLVISPHGYGHAAFVFPRPDEPGDPNACYTDNAPMADWLLNWYLRQAGLYRDLPGLVQLRIADGARFSFEPALPERWTETIEHDDGTIAVIWRDLRGPQFIETLASEAPFGTHDIFSAQFSAHRSDVLIDGVAVPGRPFRRADVHNRELSSAFLAFAETWVEID